MATTSTSRVVVSLIALAATATGYHASRSALAYSPTRVNAIRGACHGVPHMAMPAPATKTKRKVVTKPKVASPGPAKPAQKTNIAKPKRQTSSAYIPMWKVLLLGDEEYEEDPVVGVIVEVLPEIPMDEARQKFHEAQVSKETAMHARTRPGSSGAHTPSRRQRATPC